MSNQSTTLNDFTYCCMVDGVELPESDFPTAKQAKAGMDPEVCVAHQLSHGQACAHEDTDIRLDGEKCRQCGLEVTV
jgi:hypothetical protein